MGNPKVAPKLARGRLVEAIVKVDVYNQTVYCVAGPREDLREYLKWRHRLVRNVPGKHDAHALYYPATKTVGGVIWLPRVPVRRAKDYGCLVHEASHAILDLMRGIDVAVSEKHQEPFCYAIGHLVESILDQLRSNRRGASRTTPARRRRPG